MLLCFGCSKAPLLPAQLTQQIASADRVVLTNFPASSLAFSGAEAQKLIQAVSACRGEKLARNETVSCPAGVYLQFYRGTNLLAQVHGHDNHFIVDRIAYTDRSGALQAAWRGLYDNDKR